MKFNYLLREAHFHGARRLAEKNFRCFWIIALLITFGSAVAVVCVTIDRFFENPTYLVQREVVDENMEFPCVVICPEVMFQHEKIHWFLSKVKIPPQFNYSYFHGNMAQLAAFYSPDIKYNPSDVENIEYLLKYNNIDVDEAGKMLTTSCEETLIKCRWYGRNVDCMSLFHFELTGVGYCCVFNGRSLKRDRSGVQYDILYTSTKMPGFGGGFVIAVNQSDLKTLVNVDVAYKWLGVEYSQFYIDSSLNGSALSPGYEIWVSYSTNRFEVAEGARSLSEEIKQCRMAQAPLEYFPLYSRRYCITECEMKQTLRKCNCIRLVHPRPKGIDICGAHQLKCAYEAQVPLGTNWCSCRKTCNVETSVIQNNVFKLIPDSYPLDNFYEGLDYEKVTVVRIFLKSPRIRINSRWSYYSNFDLFAQLGGVFGIFLGCSVLTLMELACLAYNGLKNIYNDHNQFQTLKHDTHKAQIEKKF